MRRHLGTRDDEQSKSGVGRGLALALGLYAVWTAATWYLEGRIETLLRPDAVADRLVYGVANLVAIVAAIFVIRQLGKSGVKPADAGFGAPVRTLVSLVVGVVLGFGFYVLQGAPSLSPVVVLNAYAQVLVVTIAEIVVCWAVVGTMVAMGASRNRLIGAIAGGVVASVLFGLYHYAHSAPFNTIAMVTLLTVVGLVTSLFFFLSRDAYGTIAFHNFLGTLGVAQALKAAGKLDTLATIQTPLLAMAIVAIAVLIVADRYWLRR